jgi:hypothetical protein
MKVGDKVYTVDLSYAVDLMRHGEIRSSLGIERIKHKLTVVALNCQLSYSLPYDQVFYSPTNYDAYSNNTIVFDHDLGIYVFTQERFLRPAVCPTRGRDM